LKTAKKHLISIIIPTGATAKRAPLLSRALLSLLNNQDEMVVPIVVVNGSRWEPEVVNSLKRRRDIRRIHLDVGSATEARLVGRKAVDTQFFGMLDDDDEYLPRGLEIRLGPMLDDELIDAVITNGYRHQNNRDAIVFPEFSTFKTDPLGRLMDYPWLTSAGGLYRTESVTSDYLDVPPSMEMTYMAMKLVLSRSLFFLDTPTFRLHIDTPESLSASEGWRRGQPEALRRMLALTPPARIKRKLKRQYSASLHEMADLERANGNYLAAWRYHIRSLFSFYGFRHLPYTRRLVSFGR
jgi:glycosyltransferase involved in cell wall biosynthesis